MRAMHVDAFFEYCLGHQHQYYTQLPSIGPYVGDSRDGVPLEEDLALRALVPQWKPKRGRKRAEDRDVEEEKAVKRPQLDTSVEGLQPGGFHPHSVNFPQSAIPFSAFPGGDDPWITASSAYPQHGQDLRWRLPERETSPTGYPQSAIIPRGNQPSESHLSVEPRSAVTPSISEKSRSRRRHGPAVSSAWTNSNGLSSGKNRGRPPSKHTTSGSFSTFHVDAARDSPNISADSLHQSSPLPTGQRSSEQMTGPRLGQSSVSANNGRPNKLQLQVPRHFGAPVRLATPPTLLVNGVNETVVQADEAPTSGLAENGDVKQHGDSSTKITIDDLIRAFSDELARAQITGRAEPLKHDEARQLSSAIVANASSTFSQFPPDSQALHIAAYLGIAHHFGLAVPRPSSLLLNIDTIPRREGRSSTMPHANQDSITTKYNVSLEYTSSYSFSIQLILNDLHLGTLAPVAYPNTLAMTQAQKKFDLEHDLETVDSGDYDLDASVSEETWKSRYMRLRVQMQKRERALAHYKRKIVESVMADI